MLEKEYDGSDSGAKPDEAISWGKIRGNTNAVKVNLLLHSEKKSFSLSNFIFVILLLVNSRILLIIYILGSWRSNSHFPASSS